MHELMQFFDNSRQAANLQAASAPFKAAAEAVDATADELLRGQAWEDVIDPLIVLLEQLPRNSERAQAGRHLRSLKAIVRAYPDGSGGTNKTDVLRHLLSAKESVVRSLVYQEPGK